jgi:hypothetical protein
LVIWSDVVLEAFPPCSVGLFPLPQRGVSGDHLVLRAVCGLDFCFLPSRSTSSQFPQPTRSRSSTAAPLSARRGPQHGSQLLATGVPKQPTRRPLLQSARTL